MNTRRRRSSLTIGVYTESKSVLGYSLGYDAALRMVPHLDLKNSLASAAKINWALETLTHDYVQLQVELAQMLLEDRVKKVTDLLADHSTIVFFGPQVLVLMKMLILHTVRRDDELGVLPKEQIKKIGMILLGVSDEISRQYKRTMKAFENVDQVNQIASELVLASFLVKNPRVGHSLSRATHLYLNISEEFNVSGDIDYLDLEAVFKEATGIGLKNYLSFGIGVLVHYLRFSTDGKFPEEPDFIYLKPDIMFKNSLVSKEVIDRIVGRLSSDIASLQGRLQLETKRELVYDFLVFRTTPLLKIEEGIYLPLSLQFLLDRVTIGVYWIIFDHLRSTDRKKHEQFMRFHGKLFQKYVEDLVDQLLERLPENSTQKYIDQVYLVRKQELRSSDIILKRGDSLFLIEVSATRLQAKRTMGLGQEDAFNEDLEKMVLHNARSLDRCISEIKSGQLKLQGVDPDKISTYYPVVVTFEGLPKHPVIDMFLNRKMEEEELLTDDDISSIGFLDAEDLEELEGFSEGDFIQIYVSWLNSETFSHFSFRDYFKRNYRAISMRSEFLQSLTNQIFNEATMLFFGEPLPSEGGGVNVQTKN